LIDIFWARNCMPTKPSNTSVPNGRRSSRVDAYRANSNSVSAIVAGRVLKRTAVFMA
jgi:hypothetical protein